MYKVELTTTSSNKITIFFSTNLTVFARLKSELTGETEVRVFDGQNTGGWYVDESYEEVIAKIDAAIASKEK